MPPNPFDDEQGLFFVLVNAEEQRSLWPAFAAVPAGWTVEHGGPDGAGQRGASRQACLDFIEKTWTDLRPLALRTAMAAGAPRGE
ncbi:MAG: MbtH family protein [Segniliparus sp.]|uniref:MbtH family protein n=1 Tax=Segniliparus sp. TaxID=2804064 RepID=UPI003F2A015F